MAGPGAAPFVWMEEIASCALGSLADSVLGSPEQVVYGNMTTTVDAGRCATLYVDGGPIFTADGERWPNRVDPARTVVAIGRVCQLVPTMPVKLTYVHCVPTINTSGPPSVDDRNASAEDLWNTAWTVWEGFTCCLPAMMRGLGRVARGQISPLPPQGGLSGFTIDFTVALVACTDCTEES